MAFITRDLGFPPSQAQPAPTHLVQLYAQGISIPRPPCCLQYIILKTDTENLSSGKRNCKESARKASSASVKNTFYLCTTCLRWTTDLWSRKRSEGIFMGTSSFCTLLKFHWFGRNILPLQNTHFIQKGIPDLPQECFCKKCIYYIINIYQNDRTKEHSQGYPLTWHLAWFSMMYLKMSADINLSYTDSSPTDFRGSYTEFQNSDKNIPFQLYCLVCLNTTLCSKSFPNNTSPKKCTFIGHEFEEKLVFLPHAERGYEVLGETWNHSNLNSVPSLLIAWYFLRQFLSSWMKGAWWLFLCPLYSWTEI